MSMGFEDLWESSSQWRFKPSDILQTPSAATLSFPIERELYDRSRGVEFLFRLGSSLQLPAAALFTAATWFHRFYMRFSFEDYHRQDVAAACIFLSTKTEECGRKLKDVARVFQSKNLSVAVDQLSDKDIEPCQDAILATEEALLEALCFDFIVSSPHETLVDLFERHTPDDNEDALKDIAWNIAHDSFRTVLCLLYDSRIIGAACFILAQRIIDGESSPSLDARISSSLASSSLPTPPSNKPTSPVASRFVIDQMQFSESELRDLAEILATLLDFYAAQDTEGSLQVLSELAQISKPAVPDTRLRLYAPLSHVAAKNDAVQRTDSQNAINSSQRTPDSTHGGNSPSKASSGWKPVIGEGTAKATSAIAAPSRTRLDLS